MTTPPFLTDLWTSYPLAIGAGAVVFALVAVVLLIVAIVRIVRGTRGAPANVKLQVGNAIVQAGVTWAVVTGVYAYFHGVLQVPEWEAVVFAVFLEAATWVTVGRIIAHGRGKNDKGEPNTGLGPAGPFFWLFSILGGVLATMAGETPGAMIGRAVIVTFGTSLWYLTLLTYTRPSGAPSRFRWTPRRLLVAIGAVEPADQDVSNQHQEWQIRRLARAMRWANSRPPMRWIGHHMLVARAEQTSETVIEAARRRYAVAHLLVDSIHPESEVMQRVIASVQVDPAEAAREAKAREEAERRAREEREEAERQRRAEAEERRRLEELAEQRRREELQLQREREQREHELAKARAEAEAELEKARLAAEAERARAEAAAAAARAAAAKTPPVTRTSAPPPPSGNTGSGEALDGIPDDLADRPLDWQRRWLDIPGNGKTEKARNFIRQEWAAGREPDGPTVDEVVGGKTLGRQQIRWLKEHGELPPSERRAERPPITLAPAANG
jgi:pyruvate/2-oxoglutarate dehydrogenase complex dihydrolipoamide acyltransferase (E2) component